MPEAITQEIEYAPGKTMSIETGRLAKQANGSVVVRLGDTMVLSTATLSDSIKEGTNFFPLTVDYREKFAAGGKVPGGFIKREGRPTDKETLTARLIDRAIRPLFPDGFYNSAHIVNYVVSADERHDADVVAGVGASAALMLSGAPFDGPIAEVRVGRVDGEYIVNPTMTETEDSDINLIVAGKEDSIVMVEGEMDEVSEEEMVDALDVAHDAIKKLCWGQKQLVEKYGGPNAFEYETITPDEELVNRVAEVVGDQIDDHIHQKYEKEAFYARVSDIKDAAVEALITNGDLDEEMTGEVREAVSMVEQRRMREMVLAEGKRLDNRRLDEVRAIWTDTHYLPRVHGSAVFTRGETQVLGSVTLGTSKDVQPVDEVFTDVDKTFFLHYRFPPFCVGEASFLRGPKRREIGHGILAERALKPVIPGQDEFPYTIRVNAEVLESNGSSSMASVCAGSLALMDAGVPIKKPVAGIAMGLITDGDRTQILTDILGTEDHLGDMDFKITGTRDGITACQMDIKIAGLQRETLLKALKQARQARSEILDTMHEELAEPRAELSRFAPRLTKLTIDPEHIGAVIGPGGKIVKSIQNETNTQVTVDEEDGVGIVTIAAKDQKGAEAAIERIKQIVAEPEEGEDYEGTVRAVKGFGAIVEIMPGKSGLLHISELDHGYVENVEDYVKVGDKVKVHLLEVRDDGKLRLTRMPFVDDPKDSNGRKS
ncbi:MAG: polyribonucleotide nucleotidyltransferase [Bacteroidetes bacterium]|jgi:polyribonucleotide nucleotidyltransferase|nr:polyribonucleotide nucleotidyltransferase [Bacteroidota bacterium]